MVTAEISRKLEFVSAIKSISQLLTQGSGRNIPYL